MGANSLASHGKVLLKQSSHTSVGGICISFHKPDSQNFNQTENGRGTATTGHWDHDSSHAHHSIRPSHHLGLHFLAICSGYISISNCPRRILRNILLLLSLSLIGCPAGSATPSSKCCGFPLSSSTSSFITACPFQPFHSFSSHEDSQEASCQANQSAHSCSEYSASPSSYCSSFTRHGGGGYLGCWGSSRISS